MKYMKKTGKTGLIFYKTDCIIKTKNLLLERYYNGRYVNVVLIMSNIIEFLGYFSLDN